jgi:hypothetical protein
MKKRRYLIAVLLFCLLIFSTLIHAFLTKNVRIGKYWTWIDDNTHQGETSGAYRGFMYHN